MITEMLEEKLMNLLPGDYSFHIDLDRQVLVVKYGNKRNTVTVDIPKLMVSTLEIQDTAAIVVEEIKKIIDDPSFTMDKLMGRK